VRAAGTADAQITAATLATVDAHAADMRTLIIVGSSQTRVIERDGQRPWVYTPRAERGAS
jgi:precorrin-3B C17-methyltransferase